MTLEDEQRIVNKATTFVIKKETQHLNLLSARVRLGETWKTVELAKEEDRLDPRGSFDHEEVWVGTGKYTTGKKK